MRLLPVDGAAAARMLVEAEPEIERLAAEAAAARAAARAASPRPSSWGRSPTPHARGGSLPPERALRIGIGGPVGSGKSSLVAALCRALGDELEIGVVTNDIYTSEDALFLRRTGVLPPERILAVETGGCPHTAIRDDVSANLEAVAELERESRLDLVLVESGGDNLTAIFSPALADVQIFVIDVAGGDDIPRKGGPGHHPQRPARDQQGGSRGARRTPTSTGCARTRATSAGARPVQFLSLRRDPLAAPVADWVRERVELFRAGELPADGRARDDHHHHHDHEHAH